MTDYKRKGKMVCCVLDGEGAAALWEGGGVKMRQWGDVAVNDNGEG